jgi:small multidrug resistance family-3 protein
MLAPVLTYVAAALAEIAGCFAFWAWLRLGQPAWWALPGIASLVLFAFLLTRIDTDFAGRAFAAYGGIYIAASLAWLWLAEGVQPGIHDLGGAALCILGAVVILAGARTA